MPRATSLSRSALLGPVRAATARRPVRAIRSPARPEPPRVRSAGGTWSDGSHEQVPADSGARRGLSNRHAGAAAFVVRPWKRPRASRVDRSSKPEGDYQDCEGPPPAIAKSLAEEAGTMATASADIRATPGGHSSPFRAKWALVRQNADYQRFDWSLTPWGCAVV